MSRRGIRPVDLLSGLALLIAVLGVVGLETWATPAQTPETESLLTARPDSSVEPAPPNPAPSGPPSAATPQPPSVAENPPVASPDLAVVAPASSLSAEPAVASLPSDPPEPVRQLAPPKHVYALREAPDRDAWLAELGGTRESELAVQSGLNWLARHQGANGSWSREWLQAAPQGECHDVACRDRGYRHDTGHTGLAVLAFLAGGHYPHNGREYSRVSQKGLDWLAAAQRPDGSLTGPPQMPDELLREAGLDGLPPEARAFLDGLAQSDALPSSNMYEHAIGTFALAEACAVARADDRTPPPKYLAAARKATAYILKHQHRDGGWRYTLSPTEPSDTSVTGWLVLALKSAEAAGIDVPPQCWDDVARFFKSCETGERGRTGYQAQSLFGNTITEATTGVGMLVHQFGRKEPDAPLVHDAADFLADYAEQTWPAATAGEPDYYLWYNCTLAMHQRGGPPWDRWNPLVRDALTTRQLDDGCEAGSWSPHDRWGTQGGRIYSTALAVLTLEVYYRFALAPPPEPPAE